MSEKWLHKEITRLESALAAEREKNTVLIRERDKALNAAADWEATWEMVAKELNDVAVQREALAAERADLEEYRLRLAGALIASEGGNGRPDDAIEAIRKCPTIKSVMGLRAERDALADRVRGLETALCTIAQIKTEHICPVIARAALTPPAPQEEKHRG